MALQAAAAKKEKQQKSDAAVPAAAGGKKPAAMPAAGPSASGGGVGEELRAGLTKVGTQNRYSAAESWINGFDSRFDEALKKANQLE